MGYKLGHVPSHKGRSTTTAPLKDERAIADIKLHLHKHPRNLALFTLGINSAFRSCDILGLKRTDIAALPTGELQLHVKERKTGKVRRVTLNVQTSDVLRRHLTRSNSWTGYVFVGQRGGRMTTSCFGRLVKSWCADVGLTDEHYATHTLRKTFVRVHHDRGASLATLMFALNHTDERQTLTYCGLVAEDVAKIYADPI